MNFTAFIPNLPFTTKPVVNVTSIFGFYQMFSGSMNKCRFSMNFYHFLATIDFR